MSITVRLWGTSDNPRIHDLISKITMPGPAELCVQRQPFDGSVAVQGAVEGDDVALEEHPSNDARAAPMWGLPTIRG